MPGILVVEDDENLNRGITFSLKTDMRLFSAESVKKRKELQVIIMIPICDVNLPDGNGLEFGKMDEMQL